MQEVSAAWKEAQELRIVPESFLKLTLQLNIGTKEFTKKHITKYEHSRNSDLLSGSIPVNQISFSLDNTGREWDITNPTNYAVYLSEASKITVSYGMKLGNIVEWVQGGVFYLAEWGTPTNGLEAAFTAHSALAYMTEPYTGPRSGNLHEICVAACTQSVLPNGDTIQYRFSDTLKNISTDFTADTTEYTRAEVLQLAANAAGCVFEVDRFGVLCIEPLSAALTEYVMAKNKSYRYPEYTMSKMIKSIGVKCGEEVVNITVGSSGLTQSIDNPLIIDHHRALVIGNWVADILRKRVTLTGEFRADPRLDVLDRVTVQHQSGQDSIAVLSSLKFTFNGAWRGTYEARVLEPYSAAGYVGGSYAMADGDIIFVTD